MGGRAAIYLRVSKGERHTDNQRPDIERVVSMRGLDRSAVAHRRRSRTRASIARPPPLSLLLHPEWTGHPARVVRHGQATPLADAPDTLHRSAHEDRWTATQVVITTRA